MMVDHKTENISITDIAWEDDTYRISTNEDLDLLMASIAVDGLIHPPMLQRKRKGHIIVSGFRRVAACRKLGWSEMMARIVDSDTDELKRARLAIADNALQRPLNLIEVSRSINLLAGLVKDSKALSRAAADLGLPDNPALIGKLQRLCLLPSTVQHAVLSDAIALSMAMELGRLEPTIQIAFADLFTTLRLGFSKQREIMTLLKEIARREEISIQQLLASTDLRDILDDEALDTAQQTGRLRAHLKQRRYPRLSKAKETFEKDVKDLDFGEGTQLIPPRDFEGNTYVLKMDFRDLEEFEARSAGLERIRQHPGLRKILER